MYFLCVFVLENLYSYIVFPSCVFFVIQQGSESVSLKLCLNNDYRYYEILMCANFP